MRGKASRLFRTLLIAAVLFAILLLNSKNIASQLRVRFTDFISPVMKAGRALSRFPGRIMPFHSLKEENRTLRMRIELLERQIGELEVLSEENARLRALVDFRRSVPYTTVPALIIGRDPTNWSNSIIIDRGSSGGVFQNKAVISTKGLVGRVIEAGKYSSKILLITDPNSKVGVIIQRNREGGILVGRPDGRCKMVYIAIDSDTAPGDRVITAGFGSVFPKDIIVGRVTKVGKEPGRLSKYAIVEPEQDMSRLEEVLCIR